MKRVLVALAFLVGSVVALALSALLHLDTRVGRRAVGDALEHAIGTQTSAVPIVGISDAMKVRTPSTNARGTPSAV